MLVEVHSTVNGSHMYLREFIGRCEEFADKYNSEANLEHQFAALTSSFFSPNPVFRMFVSIDNEGVVQAHALVGVDEFMGSRTITIMQYWVDPPYKAPDEDKEQFFEAIKLWAKDVGAKNMRIFARNKAVARMFRMFYGFKERERVEMLIDME